ncbi:hypothetical protein EMB92_08790 [Bifidobacterium callitrichos]|uniref:Leucine rich repeat variant domain-containing protein n=1 Tax=Bifidobacterium callitrichos TaxID=762209 RepID=A0A5M9ZBU2_9BIFI|nr:hypothetical protein [Bifidobacterium callitrichos]KAA8816023.1 hypothetical protein EMB92_08790 [Bifidobacterium callitrichos]
MVDYDAAVAAVQDPDADPVFLAKIAYENPEFGANVAVNPRAYPGLIRWLAEFGDDRARQTVAQLGYEVSGSPAGADQPNQQTTPAANEPDGGAGVGVDQAGGRQIRSATGGDRSALSGQSAQPNQSVQPASYDRAASYGADAYVQPARNPYGFTAEQAATTTDQMQMAEIARNAPELYADLARNPNLYPALVDWLAQLHDPAVDAALAARGRRF